MTVLAFGAIVVAWLSDGFLRDVALNFGFIFLGVLITVIYVDWAVSAHEAAKWEPFQGAADSHIRRIATEFAYWVEEAFNATGPGPFMVAAWKMRNETGLWHVELIQNDDWLLHLRVVASGPAKQINFETLQGNHAGLINTLTAFHDHLGQVLVMYGRILTPVQLATAAKLIEEIPPEAWLLGATQTEGANFASANLETILLRALALIEDVNSRSDPKEIELPWKEQPQPASSDSMGEAADSSEDSAP
jgi:hypothetical protein